MKVRNWIVGAVIAIAAVGFTPSVASAAEPTAAIVSAGSSDSNTEARSDAAAVVVPAITYWAGAGVVGLGAGMITVLTISRRQKSVSAKTTAVVPV